VEQGLVQVITAIPAITAICPAEKAVQDIRSILSNNTFIFWISNTY
jgi:hypothetical protein